VSRIAEVDTKFSHYLIEDEIYNGRPARVLYGGDQLVAQSGMPRDDDIEPLFDYNQRFREIVKGVQPKRLLQLGGGAFTLPSALLKEHKGMQLDVVEVDSELPDIARKYFGLKPCRQLTIYVKDGNQYVAETEHTYDMIIMDVFEDATIPATFRTAAFVRNMRLHTTKRGVIAINVIASLQGLSSNVLRILHARLREAFPAVQIFPAARDYSLYMSQNYVLVAHDGSWDLEPLMMRQSVPLPKL
jgi:spermidine synthase